MQDIGCPVNDTDGSLRGTNRMSLSVIHTIFASTIPSTVFVTLQF